MIDRDDGGLVFWFIEVDGTAINCEEIAGYQRDATFRDETKVLMKSGEWLTVGVTPEEFKVLLQTVGYKS